MSKTTTNPAQSSKTEQVKDRVEDGAQQIQEKASEMKGRTREQLGQQLDTRSTQAGKGMTSTASALRQTAEKLRGDQQEQQANVLEQIADRVERFGGYLTEANGDRFLRDVESFARRQPWLIAIGGTALGFVAARFMKASSSRRYEGDGYSAPRSRTWDQRSTPALTSGQGAWEAQPAREETAAGTWQQGSEPGLSQGSAVRGRGGGTSDDV
jgi:hypothetical protein